MNFTVHLTGRLAPHISSSLETTTPGFLKSFCLPFRGIRRENGGERRRYEITKSPSHDITTLVKLEGWGGAETLPFPGAYGQCILLERGVSESRAAAVGLMNRMMIAGLFSGRLLL